MSIHLKFVVAQEKEESGLTFGTTRVCFYIAANISGLYAGGKAVQNNTSVLHFHWPRKKWIAPPFDTFPYLQATTAFPSFVEKRNNIVTN